MVSFTMMWNIGKTDVFLLIRTQMALLAKWQMSKERMGPQKGGADLEAGREERKQYQK